MNQDINDEAFSPLVIGLNLDREQILRWGPIMWLSFGQSNKN